MATDIEKRKVVARLREYASWDEDGELVGCAEFGEAVLNMLSCGDTERECFNALADLIEPSCDREDLRSIADTMVRFSDSLPDTIEGICMAGTIEGYARRIREALAEKKD